MINCKSSRLPVILFFLVFAVWHTYCHAQKDLGNGFYDHGVTSNAAYQRGVVATNDSNGNNVILSWLFDYRGGYSLLHLDAETGKSEQFYPQFPINNDAPYASILSGSNKYYTLFAGHFTEFDPNAKQFTFTKKTYPRAAMAMLEDKKGNIWAATYPRCGLIKYNPHTKELKDYGSLYSQNWSQYPRHIAADDKGWIYIAIGTTRSQVIAFNTKTEQAIPLFPENERHTGSAYLYRGNDGKVYAKTVNSDDHPWLVLQNGSYKKHEESHVPRAERSITGNQNLFHRAFANGDRLRNFDLTRRYFTITKANGAAKKIDIDYETEGSWTMGVTAGPDKKLYGGVTFPMRMFIFDPQSGLFENYGEYSQLNAMMAYNNKVYFAGYPQGDLIEYDPAKPWKYPLPKPEDPNPDYLFRCSPVINRPHRIAGLTDGNTIIISGTPDYGHTGGGLLFWNIKERKGSLLKDSAVMTNHATMSIAQLDENTILGGTTVAAGTGGEIKATKAVLYMMDVHSKKMLWQDSLISTAKSYNDLCRSDAGIVYGFVNSNIFFAFDPLQKKMLVTKGISAEFDRTTGEQSQRIFVKDSSGNIYILFNKKIGRINQQTHSIELIVNSPVAISAGGDYLDGRIYFISESRLCSYKIN